MQGEDGAETGHVLPEEADHPQLTQNAHHLVCALLLDDDPVNSTSEYLDGLGKCVCVLQEARRFFSAKQILDIVQWYGFVLARSVEYMLNLGVLGGGRVCEVGYEKKVGV